MAAFDESFLTEERDTIQKQTGRQVNLAIFGKHPAWDDHMDDLGLSTTSLALLKSSLYLDGVSSQIDSGAWENLSDDRRLDGFKHVFLWIGARGFLLGRIWSSTDGKGRSAYPMIACAHFPTSNLPPNISPFFELLESLETTCRTALDRSAVAIAHSRALTEIASLCSSPEITIETSPPNSGRHTFLDAPEMAPGREGFFRFLHAIQSQCASFSATGKKRSRTSPPSQAQQFRTPACNPHPSTSIRLWLALLRPQLDPGTPVLITRHLDESWHDITVGAPSDNEWFALRANSKEIPLTSQIPYALPPENFQRFSSVLDAFHTGAPDPPSIWDPKTSEHESQNLLGRIIRQLGKKKS